jgi:rSAM/selenodomain-associated transferase 1
MKYAFNYNFQRDFEKVIIIGTDLYDIDDELISEAFNQLNDKDVVIGPAKDGGYYLLGMNHFIPEVFENINWSTSEVFQQTLERISKKSVVILEEKNDIDYMEDALEHEELKQLINS